MTLSHFRELLAASDSVRRARRSSEASKPRPYHSQLACRSLLASPKRKTSGFIKVFKAFRFRLGKLTCQAERPQSGCTPSSKVGKDGEGYWVRLTCEVNIGKAIEKRFNSLEARSEEGGKRSVYSRWEADQPARPRSDSHYIAG